MRDIIHIKLPNTVELPSEILSNVIAKLREEGYMTIATTDSIEINNVTHPEKLIVCNCDGLDITAQDILDLVRIKKEVAEEIVAMDLADQENNIDPVKYAEEYIAHLNELVQIVFTDNDELHTEIVLNDDYVELAAQGNISYTINSNHPGVTGLLALIKEKFSEDELLSSFEEIITDLATAEDTEDTELEETEST